MPPNLIDPLASAAAQATSTPPRAPQPTVEAIHQPHREQLIREKQQAGLDRAMAARLVDAELADALHVGRLLAAPVTESAGELVAFLRPRAQRLAALEAQTWHTAGEADQIERLRRELDRPLNAANELAQASFPPVLAAARAKAREIVRPLAGGDTQREDALVENTYDVVRIVAFLTYLDRAGNSSSARAAKVVEFFPEFLSVQ